MNYTPELIRLSKNFSLRFKFVLYGIRRRGKLLALRLCPDSYGWIICFIIVSSKRGNARTKHCKFLWNIYFREISEVLFYIGNSPPMPRNSAKNEQNTSLNFEIALIKGKLITVPFKTQWNFKWLIFFLH